MKKPIISPPQWLIDRMEALEKMPPPSFEQMRAQFKASAEWDKKYGFGCVERIKKASYIR